MLYPYKDLIGREMKDVPRDALPKLLAAEDARQYHLAVAEMVAHVGDSHAVADSQTLKEEWGDAMPPLALRPIKGQAVIVRLTDAVAERAGASVGDVIDLVDGQPADERFKYLSRYISASSPGALNRDANNRLPRGRQGSVAQIVVAKADGTKRQCHSERRTAFMRPSLTVAADQTVKVLAQELGYVDLRSLMPHEVDGALATVAHTKGLILDMRGYPNNTRRLLEERLMNHDITDRGTIAFPVALGPGTRTETRLQVASPVHAAERRLCRQHGYVDR